LAVAKSIDIGVDLHKTQFTYVAVESTINTLYFKNRMEQAGIEVKAINTLKFKIVNESVKNY